MGNHQEKRAKERAERERDEAWRKQQAYEEQIRRLNQEKQFQRMREEEKKNIDMENRKREQKEKDRIHKEKTVSTEVSTNSSTIN